MRLTRSLFSVGVSLALSAQPLQAGEFLGGLIRFPQKSAQECPAEPCLPAPADIPAVRPPDGQAPQVPIAEPFAQPPEAGTSAARSAAPNMMGDSTGGACAHVEFEGVLAAEIDHPTFACSRTKISENDSPIPRDRVFFSYQHFQNVHELFITNTDTGATFSKNLAVDRYTVGLEKTFLGGLASVEIRLPFAWQLRDDLVVNSNTPSITDDSQFILSNMALATKLLFYSNDRLSLSGGLLLHVPTAPDVTVRDVELDGADLINNLFIYHNRAVILSPFLGAVWAPSDRLFVQGFTQVDFDLNGDKIDIHPTLNGVAAPSQSFHLNEQTLLRLDVGAGYWLYRNPCGGFAGLTGIAPIVELHYSTTLDDAELATFDRGPDNPVTMGNGANRVDVLNGLVGTTLEFGNRATLAVGYVTPLSQGTDKAFDWELNIQLNYRFGPCQ